MDFKKKGTGVQDASKGLNRTTGRRVSQRQHLAARAITSGSGERIVAITEVFGEVFENTPEVVESGLDITLTPMPKSTYGTDYDVVVISATGVLEVEGRDPVTLTMAVPIVLEDNSNVLTVRKVVTDEELFYDAKHGGYTRGYNRNKGGGFYLPTDVLEERLNTNIELALGIGKDTKLSMLDGVIVPAFTNLEDNDIVKEFAGRGIDPILDFWYKLYNSDTVSIIEMCKNHDIKTNFFTHKEGNVDALGVSMDDTFTMQVYTTQANGSKEFGPNTRGVNEVLLEVNGVVSLTPGLVDIEVNGRVEEVAKLVPLIVAKDVKTSFILEDALLTIASLSTIARDNHWKDILIDTASTTRDPGMMLSAINVTPKPFTKKGITREAKEGVLFDYCTEGGMVAIDVAEYSIMSGPFSVIQAAAAGNTNALKEIVVVATQMCTDKSTGTSSFDPEFDIRNILTSVELPNGYFTNDSDDSKHALSSIDSDYVATTHPKYLDAFIAAETSPGDTGLLDTIGVYNDIGLPKARLTGVRRRVMFSNQFIDELTGALADCGFMLTMDPAQTYKKALRSGFDREFTRRFVGTGSGKSSMTKYTDEGRSGRGRTGRGSSGRGFIRKRT